MEPKPPQSISENSAQIDLVKLEKNVSAKIEKLKELPIISKAFEMLNKLPEYLRYHVKQHTEDVFHEAILFGIADGLEEIEIERLAVAAAWHDVGYLIRPNDNEEVAVELFEKEASQANLEYAEDVKKMIMDTKLKITEKGPEILMTNSISAHLLDADVSNFGRTDFRDKRGLVAEELKIDLANEEIKRKFLEFGLALLKNHKWHTGIAHKLRQEQKMKNISELEKEIADLPK
ncbi:MAG: HD domain-containing protein [Candidatus Paceibacterota bacterium]|jgi:predicted metal-dependent HD superfamily phosphohydrolase